MWIYVVSAAMDAFSFVFSTKRSIPAALLLASIVLGVSSDMNFCKPPMPFSNWTFSNSILQKLPVDNELRNNVRSVKRVLFSKVKPTPLKDNIKLAAVSRDSLENCLDIDFRDAINSETFMFFASGNTLLQNTTLSHRYGGHQFGTWAGQLGDGRAHLLGEYQNKHGERWELQLKGSGRTPYSRSGDGRAVLRSSIREFLCSEAMHHLGVPTSRAVSLVVSDDPVIRDPFYNGNVIQEKAAIVLRLAQSWFRFGSLEVLAENNEVDLLAELLDFVIEHHFSFAIEPGVPNRYLQLYSLVLNQTVRMVTKWMSLGFAHGVCNTDNFSLLSITIDYGPFGFVDSYDPEFVPNLSDDDGVYSLEKQPSVAFMNLKRLLDAMAPVMTQSQLNDAKNVLNSFDTLYQNSLLDEFRNKLGLKGQNDDDYVLIASLLHLMNQTKADFTMTFRQLSHLRLQNMKDAIVPKHFWALQDLRMHKYFRPWLSAYYERLRKNVPEDTDHNRTARMLAVNPRYVLRNWMAESAIRKAEKGDFSDIWRLLMTLQRPYNEQVSAEVSGYASRPPDWTKALRVSCSS
ncbi:protein nucleotidyltransferase YdiU-like [Clavelina lepadiformis]|uniref:Selenoprotein O n=1 Tax=Clavelina lepadiformis TaxID=159417 RepID=A0ABP0GPE9_CLALP